MRIYRYWESKTEIINGLTVYFKAGSNDSREAAAALIEEKAAFCRQCAAGGTPDPRIQAELRKKLWQGCGEKYEVPICEELVQSIDRHNLITRNRYGALVLNSEDHAFFDIDLDAPLPSEGFKKTFLQFLGLAPKPSREERLKELICQCIRTYFPYTSFRLYRTANGFRLLTPARDEANSSRMQEMMQIFRCDPLYMTLCARQNCFRARLTPKPRRMKMKTAQKFTYPPKVDSAAEKEMWLKEYACRSENHKTCTLVAVFGAEFDSPTVKLHDELCKCSTALPLA